MYCYLSAHTPLPLAGDLQTGGVRVQDQEGGGCQLEIVFPDQLLDRPGESEIEAGGENY